MPQTQDPCTPTGPGVGDISVQVYSSLHTYKMHIPC